MFLPLAVVVTASSVALFVSSALDGGNGDGDGGANAASGEQAEQRRALVAYEEAIDPITKEGGRIVVEGLRPGITDIRDGTFSDEQLVTMAEGWRNQMRAVRRDLLAVKAPGFLDEAVRLYEKALDGYVRTAEKLLAAARATGEERQRLVDEVAPLGEAADDVYDRAGAVIDRHRRRLGLEPTETLP